MLVTLGLGALWEIGEYGVDTLFGRRTQGSPDMPPLGDTMWDLVLAGIGADTDNLFEIHLYVTDPPPELPPLTVHGRPDWDLELSRIAATHGSEDVGLFFCGPHVLAKTLHGHCRTHGWRFSEEHF